MSEEQDQNRSLVPHVLIGILVVAVLGGIYFMLGSEEAEIEPVPQEISRPMVEEPSIETEPMDTLEAQPQLTEPEPVYEEPLPDPEPLDVSDAGVKTSVMELSDYETMGRLMVNDGILQRFVVYIENLSDEKLAPNHQVLTPPEQDFRVYQQAGKEWIDAASFKRYTPYVDVLESMDTNSLMNLYEQYKPAISDIHAEIGSPDEDFNEVLGDAIDLLLDTPEVPVPIEVYTDSVMYKFADDRLESLSAPQKLLLRTGPENMRRIKAKLRELRQSLKTPE